MPRKNMYKRVRDGLIFADVGKPHRDMFDKMVSDDHSDGTKVVRWLIEEEWKRRGLPPLVDLLGAGVEGAELVPVYGDRRGAK